MGVTNVRCWWNVELPPGGIVECWILKDSQTGVIHLARRKTTPGKRQGPSYIPKDQRNRALTDPQVSVSVPIVGNSEYRVPSWSLTTNIS